MVMDVFIGYTARELTGLLHSLIENEKIVDITVQHIIFRGFFFFFFCKNWIYLFNFNNKKGKVEKVCYDKVPQCSVK